MWEIFDTSGKHPYADEVPNDNPILLADFLEQSYRPDVTICKAPENLKTLMYKC